MTSYVLVDGIDVLKKYTAMICSRQFLEV